MKVTIDLDMSPIGIRALVTDLRNKGWNQTADQINAQLPSQAEPRGDVLVKDAKGHVWWPYNGPPDHRRFYCSLLDRSHTWAELHGRGPLTIYRPVHEMTEAEIAAHASAVVGEQ